MKRLHPSPDYAAAFNGPTASQLANLKHFCATPETEQHVTGWLLLHPATVDTLCVATGLTAKGAVTAGVRALVRMAKESQ